jgi:hypothetical protein
VASDQRTHGILGEMMGQEKWIYDLDNPAPEALFSKIEEAWHAREHIKKDLATKLSDIKLQAGLNGKLLVEVLGLPSGSEH